MGTFCTGGGRSGLDDSSDGGEGTLTGSSGLLTGGSSTGFDGTGSSAIQREFEWNSCHKRVRGN